MAIAVISQASLTLTNSEQSAGGAITTGKTGVVQVDLTNMAIGDVIEVNCYLKTAGTGDTAKLLYNQVFSDTQSGSPIYQSIPVAGAYSVEWKVVQPLGTGRVVPYLLMTID